MDLRGPAVSFRPVGAGPRLLLLLEVCGVEHYDVREFTRRCGCNDLAAETARHEQGQPAAVIEMRVCQQHILDRGGLKAEGRGVLLLELAAPLAEPAVDQHPAPGALDQVARSRDGPVGPVEREPHVLLRVLQRRREGAQTSFIAPVTASGAAACRWRGATRQSSPRSPSPSPRSRTTPGPPDRSCLRRRGSRY